MHTNHRSCNVQSKSMRLFQAGAMASAGTITVIVIKALYRIVQSLLTQGECRDQIGNT